MRCRSALDFLLDQGWAGIVILFSAPNPDLAEFAIKRNESPLGGLLKDRLLAGVFALPSAVGREIAGDRAGSAARKNALWGTPLTAATLK
jgi:hypothetical protein